MNLFVYSDESGVFDQQHNKFFVFGGILFLGKDNRDICARKYSKAEKDVKKASGLSKEYEAKASSISNKNKGKLFRSLNNQYRFGVIIDEQRVLSSICKSKKDKQRYLDYVYKITVKRYLEFLIDNKVLNPDDVENIYFFVDEHSTATNGRYELCEGLEQEFKFGTYNCSWDKFFPPLFPKLHSLDVKFCNSASVVLVRASDVVANKIYNLAHNNPVLLPPKNEMDLFIIRQP